MLHFKIKFLACAIAVLGFSFSAHATLIDAGTPIPDSEVIIDFLGTGLDWTYAGPVAPSEFGPGEIEAPSFRAAEGWRYATSAEWALKPQWEDFTKPGQSIPAPVAGFTNHAVYRFTSEYWSTFSHVDLNNAANDDLTNGFDIGEINMVFDTWYVRNTRQLNAIPEPITATLGLMGLGVLGMATRRRVA